MAIKAKKILIGFTDISGVGTRLENGFRQLGHKADFYYFGRHPFNYKGGKLLTFSNKLFASRIGKLLFLIKILFNYKYVIYIGSGTGFLKNRLDVRILNFFGKKTMIIYVGCDVRMPSVVKKYKWNTCNNCPKDYQDYVGCVIEKKETRIKKEELLFQYIVSPLECAGFITRKYSNILFPVDIRKLDELPRNSKENKKLQIIHAPSNQDYKGTIHILNAIDKLKHDFEFNFKLVQNVTIDELYQEINNADLVIDQLLGGFYGLFAIESMGMGKPVICYIREDACEINNPIINANPDTIYEKLRAILINPESLNGIGEKSRKYVEENHQDEIVCRGLLNFFNEKPFFKRCAEFLE